jgi:hypothetical protein
VKLSHLVTVILFLAGCAAAQTKAQIETGAISAARSVRQKLSDPDSFRVSSVKVLPESLEASEDGKPYRYICFEGRSKNKMGGYSELMAVVTVSATLHPLPNSTWVGTLDTPIAGPVVAHSCAKPGIDMTDAVKAALKADREKD